MTAVFDSVSGNSPLLISIPHDGRELAPGQAATMTPIGQALPDTDWHVRRLYAFSGELEASVISANLSRYVVDLNRPSSDEALYQDQVATGLVPRRTFAGEAIYRAGAEPDADEVQARIHRYWRPYHDRIAAILADLKSRFGYALLWDAHSIPARVPNLFDGDLPDLNIGTNSGRSCAPALCAAVAAAAADSRYSTVVNGRFRGGHITRHFGAPAAAVHAIQLELTQRNYMDEKDLGYDAGRAGALAQTIRAMLTAFLEAAKREHGTV